MKCYSIFCELRSKADGKCSGNDLFDTGLDQYEKHCKSRKRYNRTIAPLLSLWATLSKISFPDCLKSLMWKLNNERNKYHGRV